MAANNNANNNVWDREQFVQGRARALVRVIDDFERRGRGRGLGSPPFTETPQEDQQHQKEKDLKGYQHQGVEVGVEIPF